MLDVQNVLGVVSVSALEPAVAWYERLFGRPADRNPMPSDVEWQLSATGGIQVVESPDHAGHCFITLVVGDLDQALADLAARGLAGTAEEVGKIDGQPLRIAQLRDPDGNTVVLASVAS